MRVEDIRHYNEVNPLTLAVFIKNYFMQTKEPGDQSVRESKQVLVVVLEYFITEFEFV